jgi:hypothetical protein
MGGYMEFYRSSWCIDICDLHNYILSSATITTAHTTTTITTTALQLLLLTPTPPPPPVLNPPTSQSLPPEHLFWTLKKPKNDMWNVVKTGIIQRSLLLQNTGHTQKNGAVSKVDKKFMSHITRAQHTPSAAATVHVSHALPAVRFSCLLRTTIAHVHP